MAKRYAGDLGRLVPARGSRASVDPGSERGVVAGRATSGPNDRGDSVAGDFRIYQSLSRYPDGKLPLSCLGPVRRCSWSNGRNRSNRPLNATRRGRGQYPGGSSPLPAPPLVAACSAVAVHAGRTATAEAHFTPPRPLPQLHTREAVHDGRDDSRSALWARPVLRISAKGRPDINATPVSGRAAADMFDVDALASAVAATHRLTLCASPNAPFAIHPVAAKRPTAPGECLASPVGGTWHRSECRIPST